MYHHEPQGLIWFCLCMGFFSLNAVSPIDLHYMTDRLQRFELKIFVSVLLKKQSHLHPGCPGGKQINITLLFVGELSNKLWLKYLNVFIKFRSDKYWQPSCSTVTLRGPGLTQLWDPPKPTHPRSKMRSNTVGYKDVHDILVK